MLTGQAGAVRSVGSWEVWVEVPVLDAFQFGRRSGRGGVVTTEGASQPASATWTPAVDQSGHETHCSRGVA